MKFHNHKTLESRKVHQRREEENVLEINFLLSTRELFGLDRVASHRGQTVGELLRELIKDFLVRERGFSECQGQKRARR